MRHYALCLKILCLRSDFHHHQAALRQRRRAVYVTSPKTDVRNPSGVDVIVPLDDFRSGIKWITYRRTPFSIGHRRTVPSQQLKAYAILSRPQRRFAHSVYPSCTSAPAPPRRDRVRFVSEIYGFDTSAARRAVSPACPSTVPSTSCPGVPLLLPSAMIAGSQHHSSKVAP